jgi:hypothetical protein
LNSRVDFAEYYGRWNVLWSNGEWFAFMGHRMTPEEEERIRDAIDNVDHKMDEDYDSEKEYYST